MPSIDDYIREKAENVTLRSHLFGIMQELGYQGRDRQTQVNGFDSSRLWDKFGTYTGVAVHAERMHGQYVRLAQFVDSAVDSWERQNG